MPQRSWPGSLITKTPVTPGGNFESNAASGVWTLDEALQWTGKDLWPTGGKTAQCLFIGGQSSGDSADILTVTVSTTGNAISWTDLTGDTSSPSGCGSATRALWASMSGDTNLIQYVDYSSDGTTATFGDLVQADGVGSAALSTSTRGCFAAGDDSSARDVISYVTISSTGNATDFGDLTISRYYMTGMASATRGLWCGGEASNSPTTRVDYITIASAGNAIDFGGVSPSTFAAAGSANTTRGIYAGGSTSESPDETNKVQYITIATLGNFADFGDLTEAVKFGVGQGSDTRSLRAGGRLADDSRVATIDYVTIASTGDSTDFGDMTNDRSSLAAACAVQGNL